MFPQDVINNPVMTDSSGSIMSPYPYPIIQLEDRHFIDVSGSDGGSYQDLLLTVVNFNISGTNGDYIKLGPGTIFYFF